MESLLSKLANFIFELVQLRRMKKEGWRLVGVDNPESIAEHSLRAAQIAYILAKMENYPHPEEVCTMVVFHDIDECRTGDVHKVANRYLTFDKSKSVEEQTEELGEIGTDIRSLWKQTEYKDTAAGIIAKDADRLEEAFTAREYLEKGTPLMKEWMENYKRFLITKSAQQLLKEAMETKTIWWWKGLKKY